MNHLTSNRNMQITQNPTPYLDSQNVENQMDNSSLNKQVLLIIINQKGQWRQKSRLTRKLGCKKIIRMYCLQ